MTSKKAETGAYFLGIDLTCGLEVVGSGFGRARLEPGLYLYCGSAYGPGGIAARLERHLRKDKTARWHVDQLTLKGQVRFTGAIPAGHECDLVEEFAAVKGSNFPIRGFGSSDCGTCVSHLLKVDEARVRAHLKGRKGVQFLT